MAETMKIIVNGEVTIMAGRTPFTFDYGYVPQGNIEDWEDVVKATPF